MSQPEETREFSVVEYSSFYAVRHNPSGKEHAMGDGVDVIANDDGESMMCGTEEFRNRWEDILNDAASETKEAYFPELNWNPLKIARLLVSAAEEHAASAGDSGFITGDLEIALAEALNLIPEEKRGEFADKLFEAELFELPEYTKVETLLSGAWRG